MYDEDLMGKVSSCLLFKHCEKVICYRLNDKAEDLYEEIFDKYNGQFNLKYSGTPEISSSQSQLDNYEESKINVKMKAPELIGHLTCVLWIYCNGRIMYISSIITRLLHTRNTYINL